MPGMTQVVGLSVGLALLAAGQTQSLDASEGSRDRLAGYMLGRAEAGFGGAVLVTQGAEVLLREGYGLADVELGVRNTPETVFRIASVTKPLVATAVLRLVAGGRLSLDDPLAQYLPHSPKAWRQVRIEDLLSHTSGIPDLFGEVESGPPSELRELIDDTLEESAEVSLRSEAGSEYAYNNFGYLLLAYILEVADGSPWLEVMQREVFSPAALQRTRYDDVWEIVPNRARGYRRQQNVMLNTEYKDHGAFSAGGLLSTVDDLHRFVTALDGGALLPAELQRRMFTPIHGNYALGWQVGRFFDRPVVNHTGGIGGFSAHVAYYSADRIFVAVLSNLEGQPVKAIACDLAALTLGTHQPILGQHPVDSDTWFDLVAGSYLGEDGETRTILREGDHLRFQRGSVSLPLVPLGFRKFTLESRPGVVLDFEGPSTKPASSFIAQACGSVLFTARRQKEQ